MKKIILFLLGLILPIFIRILIANSFNSAGMMWPAALTFGGILLLIFLSLPFLVWAIVASIYGYNNKPIIYSYTIGMIMGIALAFSMDTVLNYLKYNWGVGVNSF